MKNAMTAALLVLALSLGSTAFAQDAKAPKAKASEKSAKKSPAPAPSQDVTYLNLSAPDAPESDLPTITKKGPLYMSLDTPPDPDYSELDWCDECRSPVFPDLGCECSNHCSECGELVSHDLLGPLTLPSGRVVQACAGCRAGDSDGVPEPVDAEEDLTVRERTLTDAELVALVEHRRAAEMLTPADSAWA